MKSIELSSYVAKIIDRVRREGDRALISYARAFDGVTLTPAAIKVPRSQIEASRSQVEPAIRMAIGGAARNIERFHREELKNIKKAWRFSRNGATLGQIFTPVDRVGVYVPGGRFPYPSTVLMSAIPARAAGVKHVVMVTPPKKISPVILYAALVAGVDEVYQVGGPAAVAALACGTRTIPRVDLIVGPGNAYVNEAKRQVFGQVGIDALAGPSEVAILADAGVPVSYIIADLSAQAEHDPQARSYLFTESAELARRVKIALPKAIRGQVKISVMALEKAIAEVNVLAPEHLEILRRDHASVTAKVRHAGAIFAGYATPTAVGDYWAGPSHVLPTAGSARFSGGLSAATFLKRSSYISYNIPSLKKDGRHIRTFAAAEGLFHHRDSVGVREEQRED